MKHKTVIQATGDGGLKWNRGREKAKKIVNIRATKERIESISPLVGWERSEVSK